MSEQEREYRLEYPVYTLEQKELLPAGVTLTPGILRELRAMGAGAVGKRIPLIECRGIKNDLLDFFSRPPYKVIFADPKQTDAVLEVIENVQVVPAMLQCLDFFKEHDFYTYRHMLLVFALSILLSRELMKDMSKSMQEAVASPTHDFGKISVPLELLKKTNPLTLNERKMLEHHVLAGYVLLTYYLPDDEAGELAAGIARDHHERRDGSGYPLGICVDDLMLEIVVVSDIYDAMISPRPYRSESYENRTALEAICDMAQKGTLNWDVVRVLVACNRREKPPFQEYPISMDKRGIPPTDNVYGRIAEEKK
jgi:HD-GYP domain-containing protein (c-di-GMP phosphodiesterase class II)